MASFQRAEHDAYRGIAVLQLCQAWEKQLLVEMVVYNYLYQSFCGWGSSLFRPWLRSLRLGEQTCVCKQLASSHLFRIPSNDLRGCQPKLTPLLHWAIRLSLD